MTGGEVPDDERCEGCAVDRRPYVSYRGSFTTLRMTGGEVPDDEGCDGCAGSYVMTEVPTSAAGGPACGRMTGGWVPDDEGCDGCAVDNRPYIGCRRSFAALRMTVVRYLTMNRDVAGERYYVPYDWIVT